MVTFAFAPEDEVFRQRLREWLESNVEPEWRERCGTSTALLAGVEREWDRRLFTGGYGGIWWPQAFGGMGATDSQRFIFAQECARAGAPEGLARLGKRLLAPILMRYGSDEQRAHLPRILAGEEIWCQGFSEPNAGSDLANLSLRAELVAGGFRLNGQKTWTSHALFSDWCFLLARTEPGSRRHEGTSLLLVPMSASGITVRPIKQLNEQTEFNDVFFDDVHVDAADLVGPLHGGWNVAMSVLSHERGPEMLFEHFSWAKRAADSYLARVARAEPAHVDHVRSGRLLTRIYAMQINAYRLLSEQREDRDVGALTSVSKLYSTETYRRSVGMLLDSLPQPADADGVAPLMEHYFHSRRYTISAGSSEIQRNLIASRILQLPSSRS